MGRATGTKPHHPVLLVLGTLLAMIGLALAGAAASLGVGLFQQNRNGYITSPTQRYTVSSYAITSQRLDVVLDDGLASGDARDRWQA